jgi:hypothetical protein
MMSEYERRDSDNRSCILVAQLVRNHLSKDTRNQYRQV